MISHKLIDIELILRQIFKIFYLNVLTTPSLQVYKVFQSRLKTKQYFCWFQKMLAKILVVCLTLSLISTINASSCDPTIGKCLTVCFKEDENGKNTIMGQCVTSNHCTSNNMCEAVGQRGFLMCSEPCQPFND